MKEMEQWTILEYLQAGAYIAIMLAVLGVPQMLSSYFDLRVRRQEEERRREERRQEEEHRRQEEELRRQEMASMDRRHQELMVTLIAVLSNGNNHANGQNELIRTLRQTIEELRAENDRLRRQNGDGDTDQSK
jgi:type II secretory pathway pseudopilin PulG